MSSEEFAVIDLETTGLGKKDRIIEIGLVLVEGQKIVYEWDTLVNPERDIAHRYIHGISASMVSSAPTFQELAGQLIKLMNGRVLVAHNATFETRILQQEFRRLGWEDLVIPAFCTYRATKMSLSKACETHRIDLSNHHSALADAKATAELLKFISVDINDFERLSLPLYSSESRVNLVSRRAFQEEQESKVPSFLKLFKGWNFETLDSRIGTYMDAVSIALADLNLDDLERDSLKEWAEFLNLNPDEVTTAHNLFVKRFLESTFRDGIISTQERGLIAKVAMLLDVEFNLPNQVQDEEIQLHPGQRICFTGSAEDSTGQIMSREDLTELAESRGFKVVSSVTKKGCDLLVAADVNSMSSKVKQARSFGIAILSVQEFLARVS